MEQFIDVDEVGTLRFNTLRVINKAIKFMRMAKGF